MSHLCLSTPTFMRLLTVLLLRCVDIPVTKGLTSIPLKRAPFIQKLTLLHLRLTGRITRNCDTVQGSLFEVTGFMKTGICARCDHLGMFGVLFQKQGTVPLLLSSQVYSQPSLLLQVVINTFSPLP